MSEDAIPLTLYVFTRCICSKTKKKKNLPLKQLLRMFWLMLSGMEKKKKKEEMPTSYTNEGDFNSWLSLCVKISSLIVGCHYKVTDPGTPYF